MRFTFVYFNWKLFMIGSIVLYVCERTRVRRAVGTSMDKIKINRMTFSSLSSIQYFSIWSRFFECNCNCVCVCLCNGKLLDSLFAFQKSISIIPVELNLLFYWMCLLKRVIVTNISELNKFMLNLAEYIRFWEKYNVVGS